jgi:hypothetical protein
MYIKIAWKKNNNYYIPAAETVVTELLNDRDMAMAVLGVFWSGVEKTLKKV